MDPRVAELIGEERRLQSSVLPMNASENLVSEEVASACGSVFVNRVAEGLPGARYHSTCEVADRLEKLAILRAAEMVGTAYHVNVQPHSGTNANLAVLHAVLEPGDPVLSMALKHGGHLSHGTKVSLSGSFGPVHFYGVDASTGLLDYTQIARLARELRPRLLIAGASSYPRCIDFGTLAEIARDANCLLLADVAHVIGPIIAGLHPSPFDTADFITSSTQKTLRGPRGGLIYCRREWAARIDKGVFPGVQGDPHMHVIAGKAVAFGEALTDGFKAYQAEVLESALKLANGLRRLGYHLVTGGTENHLLILDLRRQRITGSVAEERLGACGISSNANLIPDDPRGANSPSGLRIGTPAAITLGLKSEDMGRVASLIHRALEAGSGRHRAMIREEVKELCAAARRCCRGE